MIELPLAVLGGLFLFLVPGTAWCLLLFEREKKDMLELFALSIALSVSLSTLSIFFLNLLLGVRITLASAGIILFILTAVPVVILIRRGSSFYGLHEKILSFSYRKAKGRHRY